MAQSNGIAPFSYYSSDFFQKQTDYSPDFFQKQTDYSPDFFQKYH